MKLKKNGEILDKDLCRVIGEPGSDLMDVRNNSTQSISDCCESKKGRLRRCCIV